MSGERETARVLLPLLLVSTTVARAPVTVFSVLFVLQSQLEFDSFAPGGTAVMLYSVGAAISGLTSAPLLSWLGQFGTTVTTGAATTLVLALQSLSGPSIVRFEGLALVLGVVMPPLHIASRALYPRLLPQERLLRVYSWDVSLSQVTWIAVPAAVVAVEPLIGVTGVYRLLALFTVVGVVVYGMTVRTVPADRLVVRAASYHGFTTRLLARDPRLYVYLGAAASILFVSGVVLQVLAAASPSSGAKSTSIFLWSVGSFLGSVLVNRGGVRRSRLMRHIVIALVLSVGCLFWFHMAVIDVALLALGFSTSPVTGSLFYFIAQGYPARSQTFLFGLATSAQLIAGGISAFVCGFLLDHDLFVAVGAIYFVPLCLLLVLVGQDAFASAGPAADRPEDRPASLERDPR